VTAIARLVEKFLVAVLGRTKDAGMIASMVRFVIMIALMGVLAVIVYLKVNYNLSRGPK